MSGAELIYDVRAELGEGPVWDDATSMLYWVDVACNKVFRAAQSGAIEESRTSTTVGSLVLGHHGEIVVAAGRGFGRLDFSTGEVSPIEDVLPARAGTRMNDGKCDARGRFWAGSMACDLTRYKGALFCLDGDKCRSVLQHVSVSNGIGWRRNGSEMFYIDSPTQCVAAYAFDERSGAISSRRIVANVAPRDGIPDGLCVDSEDGVWVALWGGGCVRRFGLDGAITHEIRVPAEHPTSCCFGGGNYDQLYITTAASDVTTRTGGPAGGVFVASVPVPGVPTARFGGARVEPAAEAGL